MDIEKLTDAAIRSAAAKEKAYKLSDGRGLYLEVMPNGSKYWRLKFRYAGKEKRLALGVTLKFLLKLPARRREPRATH